MDVKCPNRDFKLLNYKITKSQIAGQAEAVVGVVEVGRDAGAGGAAGDFDVMAPGSAAGGFALAYSQARFGAAGIAVGRGGVVVGIVPVAAPLVDVVADVVRPKVLGA